MKEKKEERNEKRKGREQEKVDEVRKGSLGCSGELESQKRGKRK